MKVKQGGRILGKAKGGERIPNKSLGIKDVVCGPTASAGPGSC